jgi:hypothetical protein
VHLLMVHGVGRHDLLSSLLELYQAARSNLRSPEAPALIEDRIADWQLARFDDGANPPHLELKFRFPAQPGDAAVVYLYEVNYSHLAGVIRANHRLDLTTLFVGLDVAICSARQRQVNTPATLFPGQPAVLARSLQRVSGVMTAATGPLLGLPSLLLSRYGSNFLAAFTRFFEDVATYALDKSGEQIISEHLDRVVQNIRKSEQFAAAGLQHELVIAGHSLGSVVTHSHLVRHWDDGLLPQTVVTFGSPIGIITWLWLFLDFEGFDFDCWREVNTYFCWRPLRSKSGPPVPLKWINVLNCLDPIASAFPDQAANFSRPADHLPRDLAGGKVTHRLCGPAKLTATGGAHTDYVHDRTGFLEILLRVAGLRPGAAEDVPGNDASQHWSSTFRVLGRVRALAWLVSFAFVVGYCAFVAWHFADWRVIGAAALYVWPAIIIGALACVQRFFFGARTKRVTRDTIKSLRWDMVAIPYRLRLLLGDLRRALLGDPMDDARPPHHRPWRHALKKLLAFVPTLGLMLFPAIVGYALTDHGPAQFAPLSVYLIALVVFIIYVMGCAVFELVSAWRSVLKDLDLVNAPSADR